MQKDSTSPKPGRRKSRISIFISIGIIGLIVSSYFLIPPVKEVIDQTWEVLTSEDRERIEDWVQQFRWWGPVVIIIVMTLQTFLLVFPTIAFIILIILAYGPFWGSALAITSVMISSFAGYAVGRLLGKLFVIRLIGQKTEQKIAAFIREYGFWALFLVRFNSLLSNDAASLVAGMVGMEFNTFSLATLCGITPLVVVIAASGNSNENLINGLLWVSGISLLLFVFYIGWDQRRQKSKKE